MKQEKLFDLLKVAVSPCECVKAAKQELLENGFEEIDYTGDWKLVRGGRYVLNHHDTTMFAFTVGSGYNKKEPGIVTVMLFTPSPVADISSSTVREVLAFGRSVDEFLPRGIDIRKYLSK